MMAATAIRKTIQPGPDDDMNILARLSGAKRTSDEQGDLEKATPSTKRIRTRHVSWADHRNEIHVQASNQNTFQDYKDEDIWYTSRDYENFLIDRLRTIECIRNSGGKIDALDEDTFCARGLEPFQTPDVLEQFNSDRSFHRTTILIEQMRQSVYGMKFPERFRMMVGHQSEMAARRARELASMDEHAVYGRMRRRGSFLSSFSTSKGYPPSILHKSSIDGENSSSSDSSRSISLEDRIRELQESNARRLIEIYSQPGYNPFRFPLRRDSLLGNNSNNSVNSMVAGTLFNLSKNRFPIRRDSLTPVGSTGLR